MRVKYRSYPHSVIRFATVTSMVAGLTPSPARADTEVSLIPGNLAGVTCAVITYDCVEPSAVQVYVGSNLVIDYEAGADILMVPRAPCFDESQFGGGTFLITAEATCGTSTTDDAVSAVFSNPAVGLLDLIQSQYSYSAGETVSLVVEAASTGLDVAVDFSEVDTGYMGGDEIVTDVGGGFYRVDYTLTRVNTSPAGVYRLPVQISTGTAARTHWDAFSLRYTPVQAGVVTVHEDTGGDFVIGDLPVGTLATVSPETGTFTTDARPGAIAQVSGRLWTSRSLDGEPLIVNVREGGTGGYATTEVWIADSVCGPTSPSCYADIAIPLAIRASEIDGVAHDDELPLEVSFGLYAPAGAAFTGAFGLPDWKVDRAPPNNIHMNGQVTYRQVIQHGAPNPMHVIHPQVGTLSNTFATVGVRRATIEISDTCSHTYKTQTQEDGSWNAWIPKQCTNKDYTVRVKPITSFGMFNVSSRDGSDATHVSTIGTANIPGSSHNWGAKHFAVADSEYGEFSTFMAGIRVQEWAKPYLVGDGKVNLFPALFFKFVADVDSDCPLEAPTSCYSLSTQTIRVTGLASNPDHQDEWTLAHETYHWFQHMFMAKLDGNSGNNAWAGAFGEGFASMMQRELLQTFWVVKMWGVGVGEVERMDFQGAFKEAGGVDNNWKAALPLDLYVVTGDQGNGGWSWRILFDFFDGDETEAHGDFTRYTSNGEVSSSNPTMTNFGTSFDTVGSPEIFKDVIVRYLGGNHMPTNSSRPPLDDQGEIGLDMTEFLDGVLCRGHEDWSDMEPIIVDLMDFQAYDPNSAPVSCP